MKTHTRNWISPLATAGYAAKGVVYGLMGILAAMAALGEGGGTEGSTGALEEVGSSAWGGVLLVVLGVGLAAYGIYRLLGAFADVEAEGDDASGIAKRIGYFGSGLTHLGLAAVALGGVSSGGGGETSLVSKAFELPLGTWLVGAVGLGIMGAGIFQWIKAAKGSYAAKFSLDRYTAAKRHWIERAAKIGLAARGVVFPICGWFLIRAALQEDASETKGIGGALDTLAQQEFGPWLLGITALGFVCYGIYCEVLAIYGRWHRQTA